ncbi:MAG: hypothetical protein JWN03_7859 [Nocardia sp.]|nr:hypothetical protein [Nocardia sp.]
MDDYAKNGNVGSDKGNQAQSGGPVFCLGPTLKLLEQAVHVAGENRLGIVEWSAPLIRGWAAATGAVNLATGAIEPTPNDEAQAALEELARIGFLRPEPFYKAKRVEPVATLKNAGCDLYYVQTYLIAQGLTHTDVAGAAKYFDRPPTNWDV